MCNLDFSFCCLHHSLFLPYLPSHFAWISSQSFVVIQNTIDIKYILECYILELIVQFIVFTDHLIIFYDLLTCNFLRLLHTIIKTCTADYFFQIFRFSYRDRFLFWYSIFIFQRLYSRRIFWIYFVYYFTCSGLGIKYISLFSRGLLGLQVVLHPFLI